MCCDDVVIYFSLIYMLLRRVPEYMFDFNETN